MLLSVIALTVALADISTAATPKSGPWESNEVLFNVKGKKTKKVTDVDVHGSLCSGPELPGEKLKVNKNGKFSYFGSFPDANPGDTLEIHGKFTSKKTAKGTIQVILPPPTAKDDECDTGVVPFEAEPFGF